MFGDTLLESLPTRPSLLRKRHYFCAVGGGVIEALLVGIMALVPLVYTEALPKTLWQGMIGTVAPPPPPPPAPSVGAQMRRAPHRARADDVLRVPASIPPTVTIVRDQSPPPAQFTSNSFGVPGGVDSGQPWGVLGSVLGPVLQRPVPPAPPSQDLKPVRRQPIRVGGTVIAAKVIYQPKPDYPELAKLTRTQGDVEFEAVIGKDGNIEDLKMVRGHPLLVKAAFDAVRHWRYQPTLLNGEPVEVLTEITVTFKLGE